MSDKIERLTQLKAVITAKKIERERLQGELESYRKRLRELGFKNTKELKAKIKKLEESIELRRVKVEKLISELEAIVEGSSDA